MQTGLYVSLSSQLALERRMTTLADNVANSTTVGFRATEVKFNQVVSDQKNADVAFVSQGNEFISTRSGGITETGPDVGRYTDVAPYPLDRRLP